MKIRLNPDISGVENFGSSISGRLGCFETVFGLSLTDLVFGGVAAVGGGKLNNNSITILLLALIQLSLSFVGILLTGVFSFNISTCRFEIENLAE